MKNFLLILLGVAIGFGLAYLIGSIQLNKILIKNPPVNYSTQP